MYVFVYSFVRVREGAGRPLPPPGYRRRDEASGGADPPAGSCRGVFWNGLREALPPGRDVRAGAPWRGSTGGSGGSRASCSSARLAAEAGDPATGQ